tara:strand:- start:465 stop:644 length:180 start_codon:yes stop_codon:yes gene_type:complete
MGVTRMPTGLDNKRKSEYDDISEEIRELKIQLAHGRTYTKDFGGLELRLKELIRQQQER